MAFAQGARSRLIIAPEASFGVLPTTPSFSTLPYKTHSISLTKERVQGQDILGDRMLAVDRHGNRSVTGSLEVDLRRGDYDKLLESVFFNTFDGATDHITPGDTPLYVSLEDGALDINQYQLYQGCFVNSATFNIAPGQMIQTTFDILGKNMIQSGTSEDADPTAASSFEPFDSFSGTLLEGGTASGSGLCSVSQLQFSINNDASLIHTILCADDADQASNISFGNATVEGTLTVYYENADLINKFLGEVESELTVAIEDSTTGGNSYTFFMPRIKYNGAATPVANMQSRMIELPFVALKGTASGEDFNIRLTRTT